MIMFSLTSQIKYSSYAGGQVEACRLLVSHLKAHRKLLEKTFTNDNLY